MKHLKKQSNTLRMVLTAIVPLLALSQAHAQTAAPNAQSNHAHHHGAAAVASSTPYAGQQNRDIKALSDDELKAWREGHGMGLAKSAELNGYPGPMHTLEHKETLRLTAAQVASTEALLTQHKVRVKQLGEQLIAVERHLDQAFASKTVNAQSIDKMTAHIASLQGNIRAEHLKTHLLQTALLSEAQTKQYNTLRGYGE